VHDALGAERRHLEMDRCREKKKQTECQENRRKAKTEVSETCCCNGRHLIARKSPYLFSFISFRFLSILFLFFFEIYADKKKHPALHK
jgi:hypothetical protein